MFLRLKLHNLETNFVFDLISLDCQRRLLQNFFFESFPYKETVFFLLPASRTCSVHRQDFFVPFLSPSHVKYLNFLKSFRHVKTQREKLCKDDVYRGSVLL